MVTIGPGSLCRPVGTRRKGLHGCGLHAVPSVPCGSGARGCRVGPVGPSVRLGIWQTCGTTRSRFDPTPREPGRVTCCRGAQRRQLVPGIVTAAGLVSIAADIAACPAAAADHDPLADGVREPEHPLAQIGEQGSHGGPPFRWQAHPDQAGRRIDRDAGQPVGPSHPNHGEHRGVRGC